MQANTTRPEGAILHVVDAGPSEAEADAQWIAAWRHIAAGCEQALAELHPRHPNRADMLQCLRDARTAAALPDVPMLTGVDR